MNASLDHRFNSPKSHGYTLIEVVVYVGLVVTIGSIITLLTVQLINATGQARMTITALDNSRRAMAVISQEIVHATDVYTPTSILGTNPGQLSLVTTRNLPTGEIETYVDFYLDDNRLYVKREGQTAELVTSEEVEVENLVFSFLNAAQPVPSVRIELTLVYDTPRANDRARSRVILVSTAEPRSYTE